MFDEPHEDPREDPSERSSDPKSRAKEKADELRMHAELFAVCEGVRKFGAELRTGLDVKLAREAQQGMAKLAKAQAPEHPVLLEESAKEAAELLNWPVTRKLSTNDYHIHRRPGEVMMIRWLSGEEVERFYVRLQAHFDAAMEGFREDERQAQEWKKDPQTLAYLSALDAVEVKMADRYLREMIREHDLFVLSTQTVDEINITYLCDYVMGIGVADLVGRAAAPPDEPTENDLAWFFKLFSLRGRIEGVEKMCFFIYLQKSDDSFGED